jgi:hypothetical protein
MMEPVDLKNRLHLCLCLMHAVKEIRSRPERSNGKATLANSSASLAALQYSRACRNFEIPDFESNTSFVSRALPDVSGDASQEGGGFTK